MQTGHLNSRMWILAGLLGGCLSGWLSSILYSSTFWYFEPAAVFLVIATLILWPIISKGGLLKWLVVVLSGICIYALLLPIYFLPSVTMPLGNLVLLLVTCRVFRIRATKVAIFSSVVLLTVGAFIDNVAISNFGNGYAVTDSCVLLVTNQGFAIFIWQVIGMLSLVITMGKVGTSRNEGDND